ncbi:MAG TPA: aldo/keto reductase [bacterium]|nr:aldo/keto reductase [bacterium]
MRYTELGSTGMVVSEIGFGAWGIGGNAHGNSYGSTDDATSIAAIRRALELGCNFVDTADVYGYGHSEEVIGRALQGMAEKPFVATKVGGNFYDGHTRLDFSPKYLAFAVDKSLERLGVERIDLYQLHNPDADQIRAGEIVGTLEGLRAQGKIAHIGVSVFTPEEAMACLADDRIEAIQVVYNLLRREMEQQVFETAQLKGVGIIAREPLANSFLAGKRTPQDRFEPGDIRHSMPAGYKAQLAGAAERIREALQESSRPDRTLAQVALQFVIRHPALAVAIPGIKTPTQAEENLAASDLGPLEPEFLRLLYGPGYHPADPAQKRYRDPANPAAG